MRMLMETSPQNRLSKFMEKSTQYYKRQCFAIISGILLLYCMFGGYQTLNINFERIFPLLFRRVQWKWSKNHSVDDFKNLKTLIILEGERIRSQINPDNVIPICQLSHQKVFVFLLKQNDVAICLSEETNLNTFGIVAESIAELLAHAGQEVNVVTVNVLPISSYKIGAGESFDADVIIRGINAETSKTSSRVSELMEPNILTGISAAGEK